MELDGLAALPTPCRPLRWLALARAYLEAEFLELKGFAAPPAPRRPLHWLAPERDHFQAELVVLEGGGVCGARGLRCAGAVPAPAMAGAGPMRA